MRSNSLSVIRQPITDHGLRITDHGAFGQPLHQLTLALALFLLLLNLSGATRGEVGRIWLFFMPLLALVSGAAWWQRLSGRAAWLIITLQLILAVSLGLAWRPVQAVIVQTERPAMPTAAGIAPLDIRLGNAISLTGYRLDTSAAQPGGHIDLTLRWQANRRVYRPYTVFTHLIDEAGMLQAQQDNWPVNGQWPPTCWEPGEVVIDPYRIPLPETLPPGTFQLRAGMYDGATGQRLMIQSGLDAVFLEQITLAGAKDEGNP